MHRLELHAKLQLARHTWYGIQPEYFNQEAIKGQPLRSKSGVRQARISVQAEMNSLSPKHETVTSIMRRIS